MLPVIFVFVAALFNTISPPSSPLDCVELKLRAYVTSVDFILPVTPMFFAVILSWNFTRLLLRVI